MRLTYYSNVTNGKLQKNISEIIAKELHSFNNKRVEISIDKIKSSRSIQQNRLWWLYVTIIAKETGYGKDELHAIMKYKFLKKELVNESTGEVYEYIGSTAKLSKGDFVDLIENLIRWAAETLNIVLPAPNTQAEMYYNESKEFEL
jgi:hypothetical protein